MALGTFTLGGIGEFLADEITRATKLENSEYHTKHLQRGGALVPMTAGWGGTSDRCVDLVVKEDFGEDGQFSEWPDRLCTLTRSVGKLNVVDVKTMYDTERYNGEERS